jgi:hypothetical protein
MIDSNVAKALRRIKGMSPIVPEYIVNKHPAIIYKARNLYGIGTIPHLIAS